MTRGARAETRAPRVVCLCASRLLGHGPPVLLKSRPVLVHLAMIFSPIAIVGAEISSVRPEIAAVAIDVALILPDGLTGAAEARTVLLDGGPVPRRPILLELLLVLSNGLPVAIAILPVGAEILLVLPNVAAVPAHVLAVLAQVALIAPQLAPILMYLWIGNGSRRLCANARDPGGHRQGPGRCHGLPSIHVILQWVVMHSTRPTRSSR